MPFVTDRPLDPAADRTCIPFRRLGESIVHDLQDKGFVAVLGPRRSGKGTLLREVEAQWGAYGVVERMRLDTEFTDARSLERRLWETQEKAKRPTVVATLQFDRLAQDQMREALIALRTVHQDLDTRTSGTRRVLFLLVGSVSLAAQSLGRTSPILGIVRVRLLDDLTADESRKLLHAGLSEEGRTANRQVLDRVVELFGGDRAMLQTAGDRLVANIAAGRTVSEADVDSVFDALLTEELQTRATGAGRDVRHFLRASPTVLDIARDLLAGKRPKRRELSVDVGAAELSGFLRVGRDGQYAFRSAFYERLVKAILDPAGLGDLLAVQGRVAEAMDAYRRSPGSWNKRSRSVRATDRMLSVGSHVLSLDDRSEIMGVVLFLLRDALGFSEVGVYRVRGRDLDLAHGDGAEIDPIQASRCLGGEVPVYRRVGGRIQWLVPLAFRLDGEQFVPWLVAATEEAPEDGQAPVWKHTSLTRFLERVLEHEQARSDRRALLEAAKSLSGAHDARDVLDCVLTLAASGTGATFGNIVALRRQSEFEELICTENRPLQSRASRAGVVDACEHAWLRRSTFVSGVGISPVEADVAGSESIGRVRFNPWKAGSVRAVSVPIIDGETPLGVMNLESDLLGAFAPHEVAVLEALSSLAAGALRRAQALDQAERERLTFGGVAHQVKTPVATIQSAAEFALEDIAAGRIHSVQARLERIRSAAVGISGIVDAFQLFTTGRGPLERVDVDGLVRRAVDDATRRLRIEGPWCTLDLADGDRPMVQGNAILLAQAVLNLLVNAAEEVVASRGTLGPGDVTLRVARSGRVVRITVQDRGRGIAAGLDPFETFSTTKAGQGLGLGLPVAKHIANIHGGRIHVEASPTGGAMVSLELPREADFVSGRPGARR